MTPTIRFDAAYDGLKIDNLPELTGSPKQIEWALSVRHGLFATQISQRFDALSRGATDAQIEAALAKLNTALSQTLSNASAAWWIDHRNCDLLRVGA
jgi:hypothetical protein